MSKAHRQCRNVEIVFGEEAGSESLWRRDGQKGDFDELSFENED